MFIIRNSLIYQSFYLTPYSKKPTIRISLYLESKLNLCPPFFRRIRQKLANENQFLKYSRYAIGEIVLAVIGILNVLRINNWNEDKKAEKQTNLLLEKTRKELLYNIKRCNIVIDFYCGKDSLFFNVLNKQVSNDDYKNHY